MCDEDPRIPPNHSPLAALVEREGPPASAEDHSCFTAPGTSQLEEMHPYLEEARGHHIKCPVDATSHCAQYHSDSQLLWRLRLPSALHSVLSQVLEKHLHLVGLPKYLLNERAPTSPSQVSQWAFEHL